MFIGEMYELENVWLFWFQMILHIQHVSFCKTFYKLEVQTTSQETESNKLYLNSRRL